MRHTSITLAIAGFGAIASGAQANEPQYELPALERLASPELTTFENDREFRDYLREVRRIERRRYNRNRRADAGVPTIVIAAATDLQDAQEEPCVDPDECDEQTIVVTGSRVTAAPQSMAMAVSAVTATTSGESESITNNQVLGVDEGDIVKRIGDYLLVLQDGRIFVANFRTMALVDRIDVYRRDEDGDPIAADWYDEMLVQGNQVIVTAYNYEEEASEISVFGFDRAAGKLTRRGVFLLTSDDYYDVDNYATRVVDDKLVIYTPYEAKQLASRRSRPVVRRWTPGDDFDETKDKGRQILSAEDIYRPVFGITEPTVHTVSICPLDRLDDRGLRCRSTGFVGSDPSVMYVGREAAFLYVSQPNYDELYDLPDCKSVAVGRVAPKDTMLGAIFRLDLDGGKPKVTGVRGTPFDQFSFGERDGRFRMLSQTWRKDCRFDPDYDEPDAQQAVTLFDIPEIRFSDTFQEPSESVFAPLPNVANERVVNRFVGDWLVYGARDNWSGRPPNYRWRYRDIQTFDPGILQAIPLAEPEKAQAVELPHQITRIEAMPSGLVVTGYDLRQGLNLGYLNLREEPRIADTVFLANRYESENRSHAFNAAMTVDGGAVLGLPTVMREEDSGRYWWYSGNSDISFLSLSPSGGLADIGALPGKSEDEVETADGYECEISCIDWYGNARPIFIDGMIFGLLGTGLVRADIRDGEISENARLDLTQPVKMAGN